MVWLSARPITQLNTYIYIYTYYNLSLYNIYIYIYICIYYTHKHMYIYIYTQVICMYVCISLSLSIYIYIYILGPHCRGIRCLHKRELRRGRRDHGAEHPVHRVRGCCSGCMFDRSRRTTLTKAVCWELRSLSSDVLFFVFVGFRLGYVRPGRLG